MEVDIVRRSRPARELFMLLDRRAPNTIVAASYIPPERQPGQKNRCDHTLQRIAGSCQNIGSHGPCSKILVTANRGRYFFRCRAAVVSDFGNHHSTCARKLEAWSKKAKLQSGVAIHRNVKGLHGLWATRFWSRPIPKDWVRVNPDMPGFSSSPQLHSIPMGLK
jgi:hypothetical protein